MSRTVMPISSGMDYETPKFVKAARTKGSHFLVISIPWDMIEPHEKQALSNHSQSLERLANRGGLSPCEAVAILEDRGWRKMDNANDALVNKMHIWFEFRRVAVEKQLNAAYYSRNHLKPKTPLTGQEIWDWLFSYLEGNSVPSIIDDELLEALAKHINEHF